MMRLPQKLKGTGFGGFWFGEHLEVLGDWLVLEMTWKLCALSPYLALMHLFHLAVPKLNPFLINETLVNKMFLSAM